MKYKTKTNVKPEINLAFIDNIIDWARIISIISFFYDK